MTRIKLENQKGQNNYDFESNKTFPSTFINIKNIISSRVILKLSRLKHRVFFHTIFQLKYFKSQLENGECGKEVNWSTHMGKA